MLRVLVCCSRPQRRFWRWRDRWRVCVENATIGELQEALAAGSTTAADLVRAYIGADRGL